MHRGGFHPSVDRTWTIAGGRVAGRPGPERAPWDLAAFRRAGFTAVVSLECNDPGIREVAAAGLKHVRICVEDFTAPTLDQLFAFNRFVDTETAAGGRVLVHCYAGIGRTGTMLASRLVWLGASVEEAVKEVRQGEPRAIQTPDQMACLHHFARALTEGRR